MPACAPDYAPAEFAHGASFADDVAKARALLAEAGYGSNGRQRLPADRDRVQRPGEQPVRRGGDRGRLAARARRRDAPCEPRVEDLPRRAALARLRGVEELGSRTTSTRSGCSRSSGVGSPNNRTGFADAEFDALLDRAERALGAERAELLHAAEARLLDAAPIVPRLLRLRHEEPREPALGGFFENPLDVHPPRARTEKRGELATERAERRARGRARRGARARSARRPARRIGRTARDARLGAALTWAASSSAVSDGRSRRSSSC